MCLIKKRKPTVKEQQQIIKGYKVFCNFHSSLKSSFFEYMFSKNQWNRAIFNDDINDIYGFYVFLNLKDAINFKTFDDVDSLIIHEVNIYNILKIGYERVYKCSKEINGVKFIEGYDAPCVRCEYIKIGQLISGRNLNE